MRLALGMALLAVVPVVAVGWSAIDIATRGGERAGQQQLMVEATLKAELLGRWVHDQAPLVLAFPHLYRIRDLSAPALVAFPKLVLGVMPSADAVVLVDADGSPVVEAARRGPTIDVAALVARVPLTAALEAPDVVHMGEPWVPSPGARPCFPLAVVAAVNPDDPSDVWVLAVQVALDPLDQLGAVVTGQHAVALFDRVGQPLLGADHPLVEPERLRPLLGNDRAIDFTLEGRTGEVRGAVVPVPSTPSWSLVVAEPADVVLAPAIQIRQRMVPQLLGAILAAVLVAGVVASSLSRPVERLRDAALRVAEGRQGVRADIRRTDEIGDLARAFDHMSLRLEQNRSEIAAQQAEIESFNRELQQRVDERTRELREAQERLVRSGQLAAVAELGAGLAHELNNPLASVLGLAQLLRVRHPEEGLLASLESEAARCRDVVDTMRSMQTLEVDPTDAPVVQLTEVLHHVVGLVGGPFRHRGVQLELVPVNPELRVRMDPVQGSQIVAQVLNALRAGLEPGATVRIAAEPVADLDIPEVMVRLMPDRPVG
ncbi:MAG: HAMP domain-containing protein, partial [Myxococcota bacterium]